MTFDEAYRGFKPVFGNMAHKEASDLVGQIRAVERRISLAVARGQQPHAARKTLEQKKGRFVYLVEYGTKK
jgi:hypothetical protein